MPTIPTTLSLRTFGRLVRHLRRQEDPPRLLPFLCMVDRRKSMHRAICDWVTENAPGFLSTMIPYSSDVERMGFERRPLAEYAASSSGGRAFAALADEIEERLDADEPRNLFRKRTLRMLDLVGRDGIEEPRPSSTSAG